MKSFHRTRIARATITAAGALITSLAFAVSSQAAATETVQNLNDSGVGSLRQAIADVDAGGTITFAAGLAGSILLEEELTIQKSLTIEGPGADAVTIDGQAANRHFMIAENEPRDIDVSISGLKLLRGHTGNSGGSIATYAAGTLDLSDLVFRNNTSGDGAGVLYISGFLASPGGDVTLDNVVALQSATDGDGGVIYSDSIGGLTIRDSLFQKNSAYGSAGLLYLVPINSGTPGELTMSDTEVVDNSSSSNSAGAVYLGTRTGNVSMEGNLWQGNSNYSGYGGVIYNDSKAPGHTFSDTGSVYRNNFSTDYGGAFYSSGTTEFTFEDTIFEGNNSGVDEGGALSLNFSERLVIRRSVFSENVDPYYGAVIDLAPNAGRNHVIEDSTFVNSAGGNSYANGGLNLDDSASATYTLTNVTVAGNVGSGSNDAAIKVEEGSATLDHVTVAQNVSGGSGGASSAAGLYVSSASSVVMRNSILADNTNAGAGSPQDCFIDGGSLTLDGANIIGSDTDPTSCPYAGPAPLTGDAGLAEDVVEVPFLGGTQPGYTYVLPLEADSQAIDAAVGESPALDGRGVPRPQLSAADLGAYEWAPTPTVLITGKPAQRTLATTIKVGCGNAEKGCSLELKGYRILKNRVNQLRFFSKTVQLGAGEIRTMKLAYDKRTRKSVRRGLKRKEDVRIKVLATDTATGYGTSSEARVEKPKGSR